MTEGYNVLSIITVADLKKLIDSKAKRLTVIDARTSIEYKAGHIEGAISLVWHDLCVPPPEFVSDPFKQPGWWGEFHDPIEFDYETKFGAIGIGSNDQIVVYGDGSLSKGRDGIIAWLLSYLGAKKVSLLDGGWTEWLKSGNKSYSDIAGKEKSEFISAIDNERISCHKDLEAQLNGSLNLKIWDARTVSEYSGEEPPYLPRRGRIPGAKLFDYYAVYNESDTNFLSRRKYLDLLNNYGYSQDRNVVSYCEMGLRAATIAFLHEVYTGQKIKLLSGGFFLWSHKEDLPVV